MAKIKSRMMVFSENIPNAPPNESFLPRLAPANEATIYIPIKTPIICTVNSAKGLFVQTKTRANERSSKRD